MYRCPILRVGADGNSSIPPSDNAGACAPTGSMSVCLQRHTPSGAAHADLWHHRGGNREARAVRSVR
eukprot:8374762-Heterocapsa_arctica.AAC.1